jgi:hypothetical protein
MMFVHKEMVKQSVIIYIVEYFCYLGHLNTVTDIWDMESQSD